MTVSHTRILPSLPAQFMPPAGWQDGAFVNDGRDLAYGYVMPSGTPRGCVVILIGRAEFREKYFETMRDLLARGLGVFVMDWYGQGSSGRHLTNRHKDHSRGFQHHVADLNAFIRDIVTPTLENLGHAKTPLVMLAHSMGGHIGLRYLLTLQQSFAGAVMCSPMMGIHGVTDKPAWLIEALMAGTMPFSAVYAPVPWHGDWNEADCAPPGRGPLSSDPLRDSVLREWFRANPYLQLGGPTWGWINHALQSCAVVNDDALLKKISVPLLFITAGADGVVDNAATVRIAARIPGARQVDIAGALHELLMERDDLRNRTLEYFDNFLPACKIG